MKWLVNSLTGTCLALCLSMPAIARSASSESSYASHAATSSNIAPTLRCRLETPARATTSADYVENARLCLIVAPFGYEFDDTLEEVFLQRVNAERDAIGLPPLLLRPELLDAARYHSLDMAANDFFDHLGPDGRHPTARIEALDRTLFFDSTRENLAKVTGETDPDKVVELLHTGLMDSPHHRETILADNVTHVAMGVVRTEKGVWLTQVFARQVGVLSSPAPLRMSPGEALDLDVKLTGWSFKHFVTDNGEEFVPFDQPRLRRSPRMPVETSGDIVLSVRAEKPGERPNTLTYIHLSGPLVTVEAAVP